MKFVAVFASSPSLSGFRVRELLDVAHTLGVALSVIDSVSWLRGAESEWFCVFESHDAAGVRRVAQRCVLLRAVYILLQTAPTLEALYESQSAANMSVSLSSPPASSGGSTSSEKVYAGECLHKYLDGDYHYQVETIGKKYTLEAKKEVVEAVTASHPPRRGAVNWQNPTHRFFVFVHHLAQEAPPGARDWVANGPVLRTFHCLLLTEASRSTLLSRYELKRRPYIGTTSMPPEESFVMANLSRVSGGDYVYDPFCGTGSLLVAAAHCGAHTFGSDADGRALRGGTEKGKASPQLQQQRRLALSTYSPEELAAVPAEEQELPTMLTNFRLYRLPPPDRLRMNFSSWPATWQPRASCGGFLDAIITDPPYGVREPRRKVQSSATATSAMFPPPPPPPSTDSSGGGEAIKQTAEAASQSASVTLSPYSTPEVVLDLVLFAAEYLVVGGRLTFWHPTTDHYTDDELPTHPSLRVVHNLPQRLSLKMVRRLVTMEKVAPPPSPRPTRDECAPKKTTDDLRKLLDVTEVPDNADYTHYREKVRRKREATRTYLSTPLAHTECGKGEGLRPARKVTKIPTQEEIVANRAKNLRVRQEKQEASHRENATRRQRQE